MSRSESPHDIAAEYAGARQTYRLQGGGGILLGPAPNELRSAICEKAGNMAVGGGFEEKYWDVTSPRGKGPLPAKLAWCGIYATWVWLQAQMDVEWAFVNTDQGANNGPYKRGDKNRIKTSRNKDMIAPGDIAVVEAGVHHFLVLSISGDGLSASVLEGNTPTVRRGPRTLTDVAYFYSVDSYRWDMLYGQNIPGHR